MQYDRDALKKAEEYFSANAAALPFGEEAEIALANFFDLLEALEVMQEHYPDDVSKYGWEWRVMVNDAAAKARAQLERPWEPI